MYTAALGFRFYFQAIEMKRRNEIDWNAENTRNDQFKTNDSLSDTCALDCCRFFIFFSSITIYNNNILHTSP